MVTSGSALFGSVTTGSLRCRLILAFGRSVVRRCGEGIGGYLDLLQAILVLTRDKLTELLSHILSAETLPPSKPVGELPDSLECHAVLLDVTLKHSCCRVLPLEGRVAVTVGLEPGSAGWSIRQASNRLLIVATFGRLQGLTVGRKGDITL